MPFKPGNNANPNGRPRKAVDPRSEMMLEYCKKNHRKIEQVGDIVLKKALKDEESWAIKLAAEMFYPKAGTFAPAEKNTTHNKMNVQINTLLKDLSPEHHASLWEVLNNPQPKPAEIVEVKNSTDD